MESEIWKSVVGYEGLYEISNAGRVKSLSYNRTGLHKIRKANKQNSGYYVIALHKRGTSKTFLIHRLMAFAFIENPNRYEFVNHKNGIKTDNRIENLEWCTKSYNLIHAFKNGLKVITEAHLNRLRKFNTESKSIPVSQYTKTGELVATYESGVKAAKKTGFDYSSIMACAKGTYSNHKTCGGYVWKYAETTKTNQQ